MKFYNTLTKQVDEFKPISPERVTLYTCGPTVYNYQHIGNFRKFVFDDTLRRALQVNGYNVQQAMNITDVGHLVSDADEGEDKLEKGAAREGKSVQQIAAHYTEAFKKDACELNILEPNAYHGAIDNYARATDFIEEQIEIIKILLEKDFAYQAAQAIYFDVAKLPEYGQLSGQKLSEKEVGVRKEVVIDSSKKNPQDFAVWFFLTGRYQNHTMHWYSPWGEGFPGWHLECSAIIHKIFGDPIDIHTGGVDHIGVHHENEIAQTEAAYGNKLAHYWLHSEHLLVEGQKMSKSLGNFYTLKDIKKRGVDPLALRLLYLQAHYKTQLNFTWDSLEAAQNALLELQSWADMKHQDLPLINFQNDTTFIKWTESRIQELNEDLNTATVISELFKLIKRVKPGFKVANTAYRNLLSFVDEALGLGLRDRPDINDEQKKMIAQREGARKDNDFQNADKLRHQLLEHGIEINDTPNGPIWHRT